MRNITHNNIILARHIKGEDIAKGLTFFSNDNEFIQVGSWDYDAGKELFAHYHNEFTRVINRTYEVLIVISGKIEASIYTLSYELVEQLEVSKGDILVLLESGHGYKILEDSTKVIEIKNGPYFGAERDRTRFNK